MRIRQRLLIAVLAAGESRRFQGAKLAQRLSTAASEGQRHSILQRHIDRLARFTSAPLVMGASNQVTAELLVVLGAHQTLLRPQLDALGALKLTLLDNPNWQTGLASSLRVAAYFAKAQQFDGMLLTLADQVALTFEDYRQVIETWQTSQQSVAALYANEAGTLNGQEKLDELGAPAIFNASILDLLTDLTGDCGAKSILKQLANVGELVAVPLPHAAIDIDTKADLASWLALKE
ncbi:xanthine dehydrogenase [Shewanella xiamenensis]|uniref:nucleotidyltransferase family protein n=1 Tax=Shewanella xiamenensis TaxID=332186 RepID=UPI001185CB64|nr:nucleotidyltransferase family protein [Shewanella xiamenensis]TVL22814.1 xanthine dehydrogenase [Shewanella xiamenensis]TVL23035.1 xanthine dehydrogenase [Shewanella xiamenensis]TVL28510.1 xanthine dehydrogenase [Shewanella xiamenensis]TVL36963.1 xanthine dehydrogenase [Shewanella xiamenensis]TVP04613.1 xanthine dehydrogenase [Shewanella xiamenensis]